MGCIAGHREKPVGISNALRNPARRTIAPGARRLPLGCLDFLRNVLVCVVYAPARGAPLQYPIPRAQFLFWVTMFPWPPRGLASAFVFFDVAVAEADHAVCVQCAVSCVGDKNDRVALLMQAREESHDFFAGLRVEVAGGLVGEEDGGSV